MFFRLCFGKSVLLSVPQIRRFSAQLYGLVNGLTWLIMDLRAVHPNYGCAIPLYIIIEYPQLWNIGNVPNIRKKILTLCLIQNK